MTSRRALQAVILALSLIPLSFGTMGLLFGAHQLTTAASVTAALDSQFRFLSGWYLALALLCWWIAPRIESETAVFRIVCAAIFIGGVGRVVSLLSVGRPPTEMMAGLVLELCVPLLILWQRSVAQSALAVAAQPTPR